MHKLWLEYDSSEGTIVGWYCLCKSGARTVGCCAHVASVLWYLGFYRHGEKNQRRCHNYQNFISDAQSEDGDSDVDNDWRDDYDSSSEDQSEAEGWLAYVYYMFIILYPIYIYIYGSLFVCLSLIDSAPSVSILMKPTSKCVFLESGENRLGQID